MGPTMGSNKEDFFSRMTLTVNFMTLGSELSLTNNRFSLQRSLSMICRCNYTKEIHVLQHVAAYMVFLNIKLSTYNILKKNPSLYPNISRAGYINWLN